jgi:hypothetical protein
MRDLTKSMTSFGWAMSVFGAQQMMNMMMAGAGGDPGGKMANAFKDVTNATTETFDGWLKSVYCTGEKLQNGMIDMMFGGFMSAGMDPARWMRMGSDALQQMVDLGKPSTQTASGSGGRGGSATGAPQGAGPATPSGAGWGPMPH